MSLNGVFVVVHDHCSSSDLQCCAAHKTCALETSEPTNLSRGKIIVQTFQMLLDQMYQFYDSETSHTARAVKLKSDAEAFYRCFIHNVEMRNGLFGLQFTT